mgnify:CR=1 FL=1
MAHLEAQLTDRPDLLAKLTPNYPPGAKRMLRDNGVWTSALKRQHAHLITDRIARIDGDAIVMRASARREGFADIGFGECRAEVLPAAQAAYDAASAGFREGKFPFLDVLDAQRALFNAEQALVQLRRALMTSTVNLQIGCPVTSFSHPLHLPSRGHPIAGLDEQRRRPHCLPLFPVVAGTPLRSDPDPVTSLAV